MPGNKVLIIDDEIDLCLLLKSYFQKKGYDVNISHSLEAGIASLKEQQPDILFLDNNLPDGTGWDLIPLLVKEHKNISVNLISAFHSEAPKLQAAAHYNIIEKPVSLAHLDKLFPSISE